MDARTTGPRRAIAVAATPASAAPSPASHPSATRGDTERTSHSLPFPFLGIEGSGRRVIYQPIISTLSHLPERLFPPFARLACGVNLRFLVFHVCRRPPTRPESSSGIQRPQVWMPIGDRLSGAVSRDSRQARHSRRHRRISREGKPTQAPAPPVGWWA